MTLKAMACAAGLLAGLLSGAPAIAQTYPTKTVRIIVPYQAGQGTDVAARYFAEQLVQVAGPDLLCRQQARRRRQYRRRGDGARRRPTATR